MTQVADAIRRELDEARRAERPVASVRVTESALPGAVAAVSLSPERAEALDLDAQMTERAVEILVHPDDYDELDDDEVSEEDGIRRVFGVPLI
ncbi:hypothetical protein OJ997_10245 [Solirubrobacter phytolaccae]|uniref:Uncharacterized protein n=1 Tax=Solirubrobacter phytolaccae TaxID=1404360 RepID=A0A9X3NG74_9ACTN|nr:hypothetical protein [Solirubrobacter phytolaccae]MDA0180672.1 hypothetical protein [Solirubrobacter phytolaccae]